MESSTIVPISGDHFENFLLLTNQEQKSKKIKQAWQILRQQIHAQTADNKKNRFEQNFCGHCQDGTADFSSRRTLETSADKCLMGTY